MKIEIYTRDNCSYCDSAKSMCYKLRWPFVEYKLHEDFNRSYILKKFPTASTYPVIVIDDNYIGGYTDFREKYI